MLVSIIIPHYNNGQRLQEVLEAISYQNFDKDSFEVLVVDNQSSESLDFIDEYPFVKLLHENQFLNSPYSARNRGIENARGSILAFLDSTCKPSENWLKEGVKEILDGADITSGNIQFTFTLKPGITELYDSIFHVNAQSSARNGFVLGGNFFIRSSLFQDLGIYPEGQRTSGDYLFSNKVVRKGYKLTFCPTAIVYYPARGGKFILKKTWRISKGQPFIWELKNRFTLQFIKSFFKLIPPNPFRIYKLSKDRLSRKVGVREFIQLYFLRYSMLSVSLFGNLEVIIRKKLKK
ncbi:MAG: glycosyltransferase [Anditalea sp.]